MLYNEMEPLLAALIKNENRALQQYLRSKYPHIPVTIVPQISFQRVNTKNSERKGWQGP
jgi:hypothetical protein